MNSNEPFENDKPLRKLLREWRVDPALPPRFQERVWERIASAKMQRAPTLRTLIREWMATRLARPTYATAYVASLLLIGAAAGFLQGQFKTEHVKSDLQARYIQMVDPYQTPR